MSDGAPKDAESQLVSHFSFNHQKNSLIPEYFFVRLKSNSIFVRLRPNHSPFLSALQNMGVQFLHGVENSHHGEVLFVQVAKNPIVFPAICKYYRDSPQHAQSFSLRSIGFFCDSYSPFP